MSPFPSPPEGVRHGASLALATSEAALHAVRLAATAAAMAADNAERAAGHLASTGLDCVVPCVLRERTTERVFTMEFEEAFNATGVASIDGRGTVQTRDRRTDHVRVQLKIFESGFVHCDPLEATVVVREHPERKGRAQLVLVDHGLYRQLRQLYGAFRDS